MGLPEILDALAVKSRAITGIAGASGSGVTAGVDPMPMEMPATPYAVVYLADGDASQATVTFLDDQAEIRIYVPFASFPPGYAILTGFPDLFETAWRDDRDLGATVVDSWYAGHGRVGRETWGAGPGMPGVEYAFMPIRIGFRRLKTGGLTS